VATADKLNATRAAEHPFPDLVFQDLASIIAAQVRHADGGALAQRVHIHKLPQTAPRVAGLIEGVFRPGGAGRAVGVGTASGGGKSEGNLASSGRLAGPGTTAFPQVRWGVAGPGFEPG